MDTPAVPEPLSRIFVISDVHVGAGELDDFTPKLEQRLLSFLDILTRMEPAVELVINGDFFDFATAAPWDEEDLESKTSYGLPLCFTEAQSCRKLANIIEQHGRLFDALARLAIAQPGNRITMMPGNHDADLFWPQVRQDIVDRLAQAVAGGPAMLDGHFRFWLERHLLIDRAGKRYWIEHGHQHDPPNSFFPGGVEHWSAAVPPLFKDTLGHLRLYECPGTLGLVRHINHWRPRYHSISYIKPYSKVLLALVSHDVLETPDRPLMVLRHLGAMLGWQVDLQTALADGDVTQACEQTLQELVQTLTPAEEHELLAQLAADGFETGDISLREYVQTSTRRFKLLKHMARFAAANASAPALRAEETDLGLVFGGLIADAETRALVQMADRLIRSGQADYVLTGHTHSPCLKLCGGFLNGGCWVPNQTVDSKADAVAAIFEHGPVTYQLSYLEIGLSAAPRRRRFGRGRINV